MSLVYLMLILVFLLLLWYLVAFWWGKPWSIRGLYTRTFLRLALKSPELLTMLGILEKIGIHWHNACLSNASVDFETKMLNLIKRDLRILRSYPRQRQDKATLLSTDIMEWFLDDQVRAEPYRFHNYPVNQMFGIQSELPNFMMTVHPVDSQVEAWNYVRRLRRFGVKFDQVMEGLLIREEKGILPPRFVIRRVLDEMSAFIAKPPQENPLYITLQEKLASVKKVSPRQQEKILGAARDAIQQVVYPAYQKFIDYFTALEQKADDNDGIWKLPDGEACYTWCLRSNTTTDYTPAQVHELGLQEVERIENEMRAIFAHLGYTNISSPTRLLAELAQDERFLYPNTDEGRAQCLADYQRILDEVNLAIEPYFGLRPKASLKVERIPPFREKTAAGAYYQPGDMSGQRPGIFFANLRDMREVPKFGMKTLAYHEGIPGHHFQLSLAMELRGLPFFRRLVPFTAYAEGWALYAERLAREIGMYRDDPYGELGALDSELFRAVRLVVDTGIHYKRWTRAQAIEYMEAHSASAHESVVSEVERYIVMPAQACAYKIGMLKILELRETARQALGPRFDLRRFHDVILGNGSVPLAILERLVNDYVAAEQKAPATAHEPAHR